MQTDSETNLVVHYDGGSYPVCLGHGVLRQVGQRLRHFGSEVTIAVVTSPTVWSLYGESIGCQLQEAGLMHFVTFIADDEANKTLTTASNLCDEFFSHGLDQTGVVLAVGGGVVGDLAGFAASVYRRGVRFVQVPTTLLAMVDASVGGKTAVNVSGGKNVVGTFLQPLLVIIDPNVLVTLPPAEFSSGVAEVVKHALIGDPELLFSLQNSGLHRDQWLDWIQRSLQVKIRAVEADPFGRSERAMLKLGHVVGYAIEELSGYSIAHGDAVSIGLVAEIGIAVHLGKADPMLHDEVRTLLHSYCLPTTCPSSIGATAIWRTIVGIAEKRSVRWVMLRCPGVTEISDAVPKEIVISVLQTIGAQS